MSSRPCSAKVSEGTEGNGNAFCIYLHVSEGKGLQPRDEGKKTYDSHNCKIVLHTALNGVNFEVEGEIMPDKTTVFNSNCIWECDLNDLKKIKTDQRPIKLELFLRYGEPCTPVNNSDPSRDHGTSITHLAIGSLLLPLRGVPNVVSLQTYQPKKVWHKLGALSAEYRANKPEIQLLLVTVKKALVETGQFEELLYKRLPFGSLTSTAINMLQSQANVHVQLLDEGIIQVGNSVQSDCDLFELVLHMRQLKNLEKLLSTQESSTSYRRYIFQYEVLGNATCVELNKTTSDSYVLNEVVSLTFKSSFKSLKGYFERIFFVPMSLCGDDGRVLANCRFDCSKYMPSDDTYFNANYIWKRTGMVFFDRLHKMLSPRAKKPAFEFQLSIQQKSFTAKKLNNEIIPLRQSFVAFDQRAAGDALSASKDQVKATREPQVDVGVSALLSPSGRELVDIGVGTDDWEECQNSEVGDSTAKELTDQGDGVAAENNENRADAADVIPGTTSEQETFEQWKAERMEEFLCELERKETKYLLKLKESWDSKSAAVRNEVAARLERCEAISTELTAIQAELESRLQRSQEYIEEAIAAKTDIEECYAGQCEAFEAEIKRLRIELETKDLELRAKHKMESEKKCNSKERTGHRL